MVGMGIVGMFLAQNAYQAGPVTASQSALVIVDPLASIAIGIGLFGDHVQTAGGRLVGEVLAMVVLVVGVYSLSRSPLVVSVKSEDDEDAHLLGGRARTFRVGARRAAVAGDADVVGPPGGAREPA